MTVQEAIEILKKPIEYAKISNIDDEEEIAYSTDFVKAIEIAIECMEKIEKLETNKTYNLYRKYLSIGTVEELKEAREKQVAKKPTHIHEEYQKHQWKKKENGEVDDWAWGSGFCNGVVCERCGESICVHCNLNYDDEPCIVDKDLCPNCGKQVWSYEHKNYCPDCGQAIDWKEGGTSE